MNERIKEIATQAQLEHCVSHIRLQEFAELIVRECAEVGSKFSMAHPEDIRHQIKKHFGVEE